MIKLKLDYYKTHNITPRNKSCGNVGVYFR